jgi:hypothetical protein
LLENPTRFKDMPETWTISVGTKVYGPYTTGQMRAFHGEGRLAQHSLVARAGEDQFHPAGEDPGLASLFSSASYPDQTTLASPSPHVPEPHSAPEPRRFGQDAEAGERTRFVIIADMKSGSISAMEEAIFGLGQAFRFMPQAWVVTSEVSLSTIRHALVQKLGKLDTIFVVDTVRDRAAWFNFGPEADSRFRRMWSRAAEAPRKAG